MTNLVLIHLDNQQFCRPLPLIVKVVASKNVNIARTAVLAALFQETHVFWDVTPCRWVRRSRRFEEIPCLPVQFSRSLVYSFLPSLALNVKARYFFESQGITNSLTRHHLPKDSLCSTSILYINPLKTKRICFI
jgi:hypothetical protein